MILDLFILIVLAAAAIKGFISGFLAQAGQIVGVVAAVLACRLFGDVALGMVSEEPSLTTTICVYGILAIATYFAVWLLARLLRSAIRAVKIGIIDSLGGALFTMLQWGLALSLVLNVAEAISSETLRDDSKPWRGIVLDTAPAALGFLSDISKSEPTEQQL